ncbi:MAG TPA: DUF4199 domain-containing protein [Sphingobacteriaceae bacterium]
MKGPNENLNKAATTNGITVGVISLTIGVLTYYVMPSLMGSTFYGIGVMVFLLGVYIFFTFDLRKKVGGYWSFKEALKGIFLMAVVSGLITTIGNAIFYKFIEPGAYEKISGYVVNGLSSTYESIGMDQEKIDSTIEKVEESLKKQFNPSLADVFKGLGISILTGFIMSLIFAAIFKKERPIFLNAEQ